MNTTLLPALANEEARALVMKVAPAFQAHMAAAQNLLDKQAKVASQRLRERRRSHLRRRSRAIDGRRTDRCATTRAHHASCSPPSAPPPYSASTPTTSPSRSTSPLACRSGPRSGLPASAVKESRERVGAALLNSGFTVPPRRITTNLAPADVRKEGTAFDLPIALGVLVGTGIVDADAVARAHVRR